MPIQQREHPQVFRTACGLLGLDHIGEVGDDDLHVSDTQAMGVDRKLGIAPRKTGRMEGDAELELELLVLRAPADLRLVLATRHDVRLGLHQLRLEGDLTEIRVDDLRFTRAEAKALFESAGVQLTGAALGKLYDRTEGWAAGLRLAALSLAGRPDPDWFAAEFTGTERTVTEYLLAEVLDRQPAEVHRLLLRTSVLER